MAAERTERVLLLTADGHRHRFAASRLAAALNLTGVVVEHKPPSREPALTQDDAGVVAKHFAERDEAELRLLGPTGSFPDVERLDVGEDGPNAPVVSDWIERLRPDVLLLYGCGIVSAPLLGRFPQRIVNLHLGLSPYYRGSATNFWPLVHGEPECVGATVHLAVDRVDAGGILVQARPQPSVSDRAHELGTKALMVGVELVADAVTSFIHGSLTPRAQDLRIGRVYRTRDFRAAVVSRMWRQFDEGMMARYMANLHSRRQQFPIVEPVVRAL